MMVKSFVFSTRNTAIIFPPVRKKGGNPKISAPVFFLILLFCSRPSNQQPMTVHRNGHTGHEGYIVLAVHNGQVAGVRGQHLLDLIHGIGESFSVDVEIEHVAGLQLGKIGKEPHIAHARVPSQHAVGAFSVILLIVTSVIQT